MKKILTVLSLVVLSYTQGFSQTEPDTLVSTVNFVADEDSLMEQSDSTKVALNLDIPDSVYMQRLSALPFQFKLTYNPMVKRYIELYTVKIKDKLEVILGLSDFYFPIFDNVLNACQLPNELKYITIIESALNPSAVSRTRAVGLWQFMKGTGKENGLLINNIVDQRRGFTESTKAAAKFLTTLYNIYGDWQLVLAAYNCGPGNVNKAIRRSGGKRTFWEIYKYLPRETRGYVPAYIGAVYAFNYYKEHNISPVPFSYSLQTDTITIFKQLHFGQVSEVLGIPIEDLRRINPQYLKDMIPANNRTPYMLRVSPEQKAKFREMQDSIYGYRASFYEKEFLKKELVQRHRVMVPADNTGKVIHSVRSGESIWIIAGQYNVSVAKIKDWNNISLNKIKPGQKLIVYMPKKVI